MKSIILTLLLVCSMVSLWAVNRKKSMPPLYIAQDVAIIVDNNPVTLRAGTPILVEAAQSYNSKNMHTGQTVNVRAKFNVIVEKQTLISVGALGTATISNVKKAGIFGRAGKMELQVQRIQAVDGQQVLLSGIPMTLEGKSNATLAWVLSGVLLLTTLIGGVVGFFIKGKEAEFRAGTTLNASVASDMEVDTE